MKSSQLYIPGTERKPGPKGARGKEVIELAGVKLYSAGKIAELLDTSLASVKKYIRDGGLKGQKIGGKWYVSVSNFQAFLNV